MSVTVTLQFTDTAAAAAALARLSAPLVIDHADRPDVGVDPKPGPIAPLPAAAPALAAPLNPAVAFAGVSPTTVAVPPAPPADAPAVAPAGTPPSAATAPTAALVVERDSAGLPWDARIHASTKTKKADGTWTAKRNVDDALRATIEAELRGQPAPVTAPAAPPNPVAVQAALTALQATPSAPPGPPPAEPPAMPPQAETFPLYMARIGGVYTSRPLDAVPAMNAALASVGLQTIGQLAGHPELIPQVDAAFQAALAAPK